MAIASRPAIPSRSGASTRAGDGRTERFAMNDLKATAAAGFVVILAVIIAFLVEVAKGHSGNPYTWLGAIAGLAYTIAIGVLRWRS